MRIEELIKKFHAWIIEDVVKPRMENKEMGRNWAYAELGYTKELSTADYQSFFERGNLNDEYVRRYLQQFIPTKQAHAMLQPEINMIYSFHKCFAMRNATRLQYYRNDLSQKAKRNLTAVNQAIGKFKVMRNIAERGN